MLYTATKALDVLPKGGSEVVEKHGVFAIGGAPAYPFGGAGALYLIAVLGCIGPAGLPTQKPTPGPLAAALSAGRIKSSTVLGAPAKRL